MSAGVANVIASVYRCSNPGEAFLLHRAQKVAWIFLPMQTRFCDGRCIETAFESEPGFFRCVIKSTDNEVFAVVSLRTPRQFLVLVRKPDRKSTRLNSSHQIISYAVFCLKKKK